MSSGEASCVAEDAPVLAPASIQTETETEIGTQSAQPALDNTDSKISDAANASEALPPAVDASVDEPSTSWYQDTFAREILALDVARAGKRQMCRCR